MKLKLTVFPGPTH